MMRLRSSARILRENAKRALNGWPIVDLGHAINAAQAGAAVNASGGRALTDQMAGQITAVFVVLQQHLTIDNGRMNTTRSLFQSRRAGRQIVDQLGHVLPDIIRVEHHQIGIETFADQSAVVETPGIGGTACSRVKACLSRTQCASKCVCRDESIICATCAPESENVTTLRGCFIISRTWS